MTTEKPPVADHIRQPKSDHVETPLESKDSENRRTASNSDSDTTESKLTRAMPIEIGGPKGLEPTRYGDWEAKGRCYDF